MAVIKRPLTDNEASLIRDALPKTLKPLIDLVATVQQSCWTCEHFTTDTGGLCKLHNRNVAVDKRKFAYDCWEYDFEPF